MGSSPTARRKNTDSFVGSARSLCPKRVGTGQFPGIDEKKNGTSRGRSSSRTQNLSSSGVEALFQWLQAAQVIRRLLSRTGSGKEGTPVVGELCPFGKPA
jgi:hypothetical protein